MSELNANSVEPDLDLHCLPMSLLWDTRFKWVKTLFQIASMYVKQNESETCDNVFKSDKL